jgi:hypothetical protein
MHIDNFFILLISVFFKSTQVGIYTLYGGEYFNYCIYVGVIMIISKKKNDLSKCLSIRGLFFSILMLGNYCLYLANQQSSIYVLFAWLLFIFYIIVDKKSDGIILLMFKIAGLIKDDEDFDTFHLESMSRRRFSSDFFLEIAQESKQTKEYIEAVKKQEYIYHITYPEDEQKIENFTKFSKIVLMVIHCIREKVKDA